MTDLTPYVYACPALALIYCVFVFLVDRVKEAFGWFLD